MVGLVFAPRSHAGSLADDYAVGWMLVVLSARARDR